MADETHESPEAPGSPEPTAATDPSDPSDGIDPTEPTAPTEPVDAPTQEAAVVVAAPAEPARRRSTLTVPTWAAVVAGVVVLLLLLGGSFAIGRETADDDGATQTIRVPSVEEIPRFVPDGPDGPDELPRGVSRAFFGVSVEAADDGVAVLRVSSGSPAEAAGIREGDVITEVDGEAVSSPAEFAEEIRDHDPGDEVTITYTRDGDTNEATVRLADRFERSTPAD